MAKLSTISQHIGKNTYFISGFPFSEYYEVEYYQAKDKEELERELFINLENLIEKSNGKYFCAVTADKYQEVAMNCLKKLGFKSIIKCYSSHSCAKESNETLTLWVKTLSDKSDITNKSIVSQDSFSWNCSLYIKLSSDDYKKRLTLTVLDTENDKEFKKIKNMPLSYRLVGEEL